MTVNIMCVSTEDRMYFKMYFYYISETPLVCNILSCHLIYVIMETTRDIKAVSLGLWV